MAVALETLWRTQTSMSQYIFAESLPQLEYKVGDLAMLDARIIKTKRPTRKLAPEFNDRFPVTQVGTGTSTSDLGA